MSIFFNDITPEEYKKSLQKKEDTKRHSENKNLDEKYQRVFDKIEVLYNQSMHSKTDTSNKIAAGCQVLNDFVEEYKTMGYATGAKIAQMDIALSDFDRLEAFLSDEDKYKALTKIAIEINDCNHSYVKTDRGVRSITKNSL